MTKVRNDILNWKLHVINVYYNNLDGIGRGLARELGVPWGTLSDFKYQLRDGIVTPESMLTKPKILLTDIETAYMEVSAWSLWDNFTSIHQIKKDWCVLSHASKWLGAPLSEAMYWDIKMGGMEDLYTRNDKLLCEQLWKLLDEADIVIGHNAKRFDVKKMNARFLFWGMGIPSPYKVIDTLNIAKANFACTSNKLDYLATHLGLENKVAHEGMALWDKCLKGEPEAWQIMKDYNIWDTGLLEQVYLLIRHWDKKHPNMALYYNDYATRCNICGSTNVHKVEGRSVNTNLSKFGSYKCGDCGTHLRNGQNELSKEKRASLLRTIAQ